MLKLARRFFGRFRLNLIIGPLCKLIEVVFDVLTPIVVALMIDEGVSRHSLPTVLFYGGVLGVFALVGIAFALVCQKMASRASQGIGTEIRATLYQHINELSALIQLPATEIAALFGVPVLQRAAETAA